MKVSWKHLEIGSLSVFMNADLHILDFQMEQFFIV